MVGGRGTVEREHLASAVLADDTRFGIYRHIAERPGAQVTVVDVAEQFGLHPNVARMHLGKLEQAGFLVASQRRSPGGGRPAKLYRLADGVQVFAIPPRRYELLAELALDVIAATAKQEAVEAVCREAGQTEGRRYMADQGTQPVRAGRAGRSGARGGRRPRPAAPRLAGRRRPSRRRPQLRLSRDRQPAPRSRLRHAPRLPGRRRASPRRHPQRTLRGERRVDPLRRRLLPSGLLTARSYNGLSGVRRVIEWRRPACYGPSGDSLAIIPACNVGADSRHVFGRVGAGVRRS